MKLATTTADFYRYVMTPADAVRCYEGTGFRYLDYNFYKEIYPGSPFLGDNWMAEVKDAAKAAEQLGFTFVQAHSPDYDCLDMKTDHEVGVLAAKRSIEACAWLGVKDIVVHPGCNYRYPEERDKFFEKNRDFYRKLFPIMEKHNINVLIENGAENNVGRRCDFMTATDMTDFIEYINHPLIHACWDVGHANMRGTNQHDDICKLGKELYAVHIQDNFGDYDEHFAPFMGTLNLDAIMQGLLEIDYPGYFTFESGNILTREGAWPHPRQEFMGNQPNRLMTPSLKLKQKSIELLYEIGKYILESYDCFEE